MRGAVCAELLVDAETATLIFNAFVNRQRIFGTMAVHFLSLNFFSDQPSDKKLVDKKVPLIKLANTLLASPAPAKIPS